MESFLNLALKYDEIYVEIKAQSEGLDEIRTLLQSAGLFGQVGRLKS